MLVCAVLSAGAVGGSLATPHRLADASSFVLMTDSLLHDGDLRFDRVDLARAKALRFDDVPAGLMLVKRADGVYAYGKPALYALVAVPWYALLGVRGFLALNGVLLAALVLIGAAVVAPRLGWRNGVLVAAGVHGLSVVPAYLHWIDPFLLLSVLVAGGFAAHRRGWPALCGAALGAAAAYRFPYAVLLAVPLVLHLHAGRMQAAGRLVAGALAIALGLATITFVSAGQWSPYTGDRYYYEASMPFETPEEVGRPFSRDGVLERWQPPPVAQVMRGLVDFVVGRYAGVLLYFPTFFACLLWLRRWDVERVAWLMAIAGFALALELTVPHNRIGGAHALGNRFFVLLPIALGFVDGVAWRPWRVAGSIALALLAMPVVRSPVDLSHVPGRTLLAWPQRLFPFEWSLAEHVSYPACFPGFCALSDNQYDWEASSGAVWTVGGTRADFVLVRPSESPARLRLWSFLPEARVIDGDTVRTVRFDGGAREITLARPKVVYRNEYAGDRETAVYAVTIETDRAFRPALHGFNADERALGVHVRALP